VLLSLVALLLKTTTLGKSMRALADNLTWPRYRGSHRAGHRPDLVLAGGLAAFAGIFAAIYQTALTPTPASSSCSTAAVVLGGIGSAYGALAGIAHRPAEADRGRRPAQPRQRSASWS
jgi:branched-subunit amino acid ABC-type transport system permease component